MALSLVLGGAGFTPEYADVTAEVTLVSLGKGLTISRSHPRAERVRGLATFSDISTDHGRSSAGLSRILPCQLVHSCARRLQRPSRPQIFH